jgi:hypothetical protein
MPPRSARVEAAVEDATTALSPLPLLVVLHIFSLLPLDCRMRCSEVCRSWRSVLLERSLWTPLDLTAVNGLRNGVRLAEFDTFVRCAVARAGDGLQSLRVDELHILYRTLLEVATAQRGCAAGAARVR